MPFNLIENTKLMSFEGDEMNIKLIELTFCFNDFWLLSKLHTNHELFVCVCGIVVQVFYCIHIKHSEKRTRTQTMLFGAAPAAIHGTLSLRYSSVSDINILFAFDYIL